MRYEVFFTPLHVSCSVFISHTNTPDEGACRVRVRRQYMASQSSFCPRQPVFPSLLHHQKLVNVELQFIISIYHSYAALESKGGLCFGSLLISDLFFVYGRVNKHFLYAFETPFPVSSSGRESRWGKKDQRRSDGLWRRYLAEDSNDIVNT